MKIAAIPVAHTQYRVVFTKNPPVIEGEVCQGACDYNTRTITIWRNPNAMAMRSCIFHEWAHAFFHEIGRDALADDHTVITALEIALMRVRLEIPSL